MSALGSDASLRACQRSGTLTPGSKSPRTDENGYSNETRKRKRAGGDMEELLNDYFVVKPYPSTIQSKPRTLRPVALLPRAELSLTYLDLRSSCNPLPEARFFESHVKILELESRIGDQPMLLISRLDDGKTHYVVELESRGLYVLCKLGSWVDVDGLCTEAVCSVQLPRSVRQDRSSRLLVAPFLEAKHTIAPDANKFSAKKRLAIEEIQSMIKRPSMASISIDASVTSPEKSVTTPVLTDPLAAIQTDIFMTEKELAQQTSSSILENVRTQYLESLYLSKTSLAYFAKGPLSRARAAFHLDCDSNLDMKDLVAFLESLALSSVVIDKKYKEGIPAIISDLECGGQSALEGTKEKASRKRKTRKMKLGRNGLYPTEEDLVRQWWDGHDTDAIVSLPGDTQEDMHRKRMTHLRIRETQLQMIVILETLALQPLVTGQDDGEVLPLMEIKETTVSKPSAKTKRPRDLAAMSDMLVDRLCIWQSVAEEEGSSNRRMSMNVETTVTGSFRVQTNAADVLRDFCTEVIVPFFLSRLPERCADISHKLGGPVAPALTRPRLLRMPSSSSSIKTRPGAITKRSAPAREKPSKSLQRVLTDDRSQRRSVSRGPAGAISLMRSATMPIIPNLKREDSESPSLSSVPPTKARNLSAKEVDFKDLANTGLPENKRDAAEAELRSAIAALKKPNRQLAGQIFMETAERRTLGAMHPRKSKKPVRNPLFQGVQIQATPRANRQKNMIESYQSPMSQLQLHTSYTGIVPPSSVPVVPQSACRTNAPPQQNLLGETPTRVNKHSIVDSTPSRRLSMNLCGSTAGIPASSPLQSRSSYSQPVFKGPPPRMSGLESSRTDDKTDRICSTPQKPLQNVNLNVCPDSTRKADGDLLSMVHDGESLFETLGWV